MTTEERERWLLRALELGSFEVKGFRKLGPFSCFYRTLKVIVMPSKKYRPRCMYCRKRRIESKMVIVAHDPWLRLTEWKCNLNVEGVQCIGPQRK